MASGTSMLFAHLSGIVALSMTEHPYWSPTAIKFEIMTTSDIVNLSWTKSSYRPTYSQLGQRM
ncbi:hypothetical protein ACJIZ3_004048 [Penstemon smallii]|uniref:Peptidase S8/S53 domain-containing protein n=1 Tax=Penstemon smallii TaxID=265156 RepID=A0ABD3S163_9LAMI